MFNVCCGPKLILMHPVRFASGMNIERGPQQTSNTENLWLNVIITHSKFISSSFISFSTIIPIFSPSFSLLCRDVTGKSTFEVNTCRSRQSVSESQVLKSKSKNVGFFVILHDKLSNRMGKMSGTVRALTLDRR